VVKRKNNLTAFWVGGRLAASKGELIMSNKPNFRDPVFVRSDDTCDVKASVVEWGCDALGISVNIEGSSGIVLINAEDWPTIVSCINAELQRVQ